MRKVSATLPENPLACMPDIDEAYRLSPSPDKLYTKLVCCEAERRYKEAADIARELGLAELVEAYESMQGRFAAV